jgi:hypothetical protein
LVGTDDSFVAVGVPGAAVRAVWVSVARPDMFADRSVAVIVTGWTVAELLIVAV